mgnify:CR=1 FL=1
MAQASKGTVPAFAGDPLSKWYWFVPQAAYFALFVLMNVPGLELPAAAAAFVIATPFALVAQVAYLLRVVYPAPGRELPQESPTDEE